jgi:hypothetical protein
MPDPTSRLADPGGPVNLIGDVEALQFRAKALREDIVLLRDCEEWVVDMSFRTMAFELEEGIDLIALALEERSRLMKMRNMQVGKSMRDVEGEGPKNCLTDNEALIAQEKSLVSLESTVQDFRTCRELPIEAFTNLYRKQRVYEFQISQYQIQLKANAADHTSQIEELEQNFETLETKGAEARNNLEGEINNLKYNATLRESEVQKQQTEQTRKDEKAVAEFEALQAQLEEVQSQHAEEAGFQRELQSDSVALKVLWDLFLHTDIDLNKQKEEVESLKAELAELALQKIELEATINDHQRAITTQQESHDRKSAEYIQQIQVMERKAKSQEDSVEASAAETSIEKESLQEQTRALQAKLDETQSDNRQLQTGMARQATELDATKSLVQSEKRKVNRLTKDLQICQKQLEESDSKAKELESAASRRQTSFDSLRALNTKTEEENGQLRLENSRWKTGNTGMEREVGSADCLSQIGNSGSGSNQQVCFRPSQGTGRQIAGRKRGRDEMQASSYTGTWQSNNKSPPPRAKSALPLKHVNCVRCGFRHIFKRSNIPEVS